MHTNGGNLENLLKLLQSAFQLELRMLLLLK